MLQYGIRIWSSVTDRHGARALRALIDWISAQQKVTSLSPEPLPSSLPHCGDSRLIWLDQQKAGGSDIGQV